MNTLLSSLKHSRLNDIAVANAGNL